MRAPRQVRKRVKEDEEDSLVEGREMLPEETAEPNTEERKPVRLRKGGPVMAKPKSKAKHERMEKSEEKGKHNERNEYATGGMARKSPQLKGWGKARRGA